VLIALGAAAVAYWQAGVTVASESWGLQPVVVVYESYAMPNDPVGSAPLVSQVYLVNEGPGTAFNVSFGIEVGDFCCAYRPRGSTLEGKGDFPRVVRGGGGRAPEDEGWYSVEVPSSLREQIKARFYWCEYSDALGRIWRTRNWWDPGTGLAIDSLRRRERRKVRACDEG
jgi:hypothetical protein